jgi:hypothetical protein
MGDQPASVYERVTIRTDRSPDSLIRVVWADSSGAQFKPYRLYPRTLLDKGDAARIALKDITREYLNPHPNFSPSIHELADAGYKLKLGLFGDYPPEDEDLVEPPKLWFNELLRDRDRLILVTIHADPILLIPWGLLHNGDLESTDDIYDSFWAVRHQVAVLYNGMKPQQLKQPRSAENVRLLFALNQEVFEKTYNGLDEADRDFIREFLKRPVGRAFSTAGCRQRWREVGNNDCIIYFFGYAKDSEIHLSDTDRLSPSAFRALFSRESRVVRERTTPIYVLTFLNGCETVTGRDINNFLAATASPGFCGYIGAEAVVHDRFGILFGHELLHRLFTEGLPLREAMARLWRKHRPMGLLYGCYAHPDFAINSVEPSVALPSGFGPPNFHPRQNVEGAM